MELGAILGVIWTLHLLLFLYSEFISIPAYASPLSLILVCFIYNPINLSLIEIFFKLIQFYSFLMIETLLPRTRTIIISLAKIFKITFIPEKSLSEAFHSK